MLALVTAVSASAGDITTCGQTVATGDIGELQNDLTCSTGEVGVTLERAAKLRLNGHSITGGSAGVLGPPAGRFEVRGPGTIAGAEVAGIYVGPDASAKVSDLTIQGSYWGIEGDPSAGSRSRVKAVDVIATGNTYIGIEAVKLVLRNVDASGNPGLAGIQGSRISGADVTASNNGTPPATSGWGYGVVGFSRVRLRNLVATGNNQAGVLSIAVPLVLDGAIVTGNNGELGAGVDVQSIAFPHLRDVTCNLSDRWGVAGVQPWGVCSGD
jgi:hypothetical protein